LRPATLSKFEAGLWHAAWSSRARPISDRPRSNPKRPWVMWPTPSCGASSASCEQGARYPAGEDLEELHEMRVATRRLRAALDFFADVLPLRARTFRDELGWLAAVLGAVRDLDVQLEAQDAMVEAGQRELWAD